jgi:hypothetical protein
MNNFLEELKDVGWFKPKTAPNPEWKTFYAPTWGQAYHLAYQAAVSFTGKPEWKPLIDPGTPKNPTPDKELEKQVASAQMAERRYDEMYNTGDRALTSASTKYKIEGEWNGEEGVLNYINSLWRIYDEAKKAMDREDWSMMKPVTILSDGHDEKAEASEALMRDLQHRIDMILLMNVDFPGKKELTQHAKDRIEVWKKGYALCCDATMVPLYVYCKKNP